MVDWDQLPEKIRKFLDWDDHYSSTDVSKLDAAYQAWYKGVIARNASLGLDRDTIRPDVRDNYYFLRKYYHPLWSYYVLALRLVLFYNPIRELRAFASVRHCKRVALYQNGYPHTEDIEVDEHLLPDTTEKVAVIIPTLNRYDYLEEGLRDLEQQTYRNFEVVVVDQSRPFRREFYDQFALGIQVIRQEEPALWLARNTAVRHTDARFLLFYDDDSRVDPDWIAQHLRCLEHFDCDISSGVSLSTTGAPVPPTYAFFKWSDQLDTGNVMVRREVFYQTGLFDRQFEKQRMGDGEFGLRCYLAGFTNVSNPYAKRIHLKVGSGGLRQMGHWDAFRPKKIWAPRPIPSVLYYIRKYHGDRVARYLLLSSIPPSILPYRFKGRMIYIFLSFPLALFLAPIILYQINWSWRLASAMLAQGPRIEQLEK